MAGAKACDAVYHVEPPPTGRKLRELLYSTFFVADHSVHFYVLAGPDFVCGPKAPVAERNVLGLIQKVGIDAGKRFFGMRRQAHEVIKPRRKQDPSGDRLPGMSRGASRRSASTSRRCRRFRGLRAVHPGRIRGCGPGNHDVDLVTGSTSGTRPTTSASLTRTTAQLTTARSVLSPDGTDRQVPSQLYLERIMSMWSRDLFEHPYLGCCRLEGPCRRHDSALSPVRLARPTS